MRVYLRNEYDSITNGGVCLTTFMFLWPLMEIARIGWCIRNKVTEIWNNISRPGDFITVLCGSHTGNVPAITMTEGLPIEYVLLEELRNQMKHIYGNNQGRFVNPLYKGPFHTSFEFQIFGDAVIVDPQRGSEVDKALALYEYALATKRREAEMGPEEANLVQERIQKRKESMRKKWDFVRVLK